jgi:hypothetical protein
VHRAGLTLPHRPNLPQPLVRTAIFVAPFALAFACFLGVFLAMDPSPTGDEPHYLLIANSIVLDGDIDLANDYASLERTQPTCNCFPLEPHGHRYTSDALYPQHGLALPVLLAPALALDGLDLARLFMVLIAALLADQLFRLLRDLGPARAGYRWLAWAAVVFCLPLIVYSNQLFPELPGALLVVVGLRAALRARSMRALFLGGLAAAVLPWFNVRYFTLAAFLVSCLLYAAARNGVSAKGGGIVGAAWAELKRIVRTLAHERRGAAATVLTPVVISIVVLGVVFNALYGRPTPDAPFRYSPYELGGGGWTFWYEFLFGEIVDPGVGWIPYAPVHLLGLAGIGLLLWRYGSKAALILAGLLLYAAVVASTGTPAGTTFPGRYLLVVIPLVAVPLALLLDRVREARYVFVPLAVLSLVISIGAVRNHDDLYPFALDRGHTARLAVVGELQTLFPRPREVPDYLVPSFAAARPNEFPPHTGRLRNGVVSVSRSRGDKPGLALWGPYATLRPGRYEATFRLAARGPAGAPVARIEVFHLPNSILVHRELTAADIGSATALKRIELRFETPGGVPIETRVFYGGVGTLFVGRSTVRSLPGTAEYKAAGLFPDWPLALVWVAGTMAFALLFLRLGSDRALGPGKRKATAIR